MDLVSAEALRFEGPVLVPKRGPVIPAALPPDDAGTVLAVSAIWSVDIQRNIQGLK